jgi:hypothetical protein
MKFHVVWLHWAHNPGKRGKAMDCWRPYITIAMHEESHLRAFVVDEWARHSFPSHWGSNWRRHISIRPEKDGDKGPVHCPPHTFIGE